MLSHGWPGSVHDTRVWSDVMVEYSTYPQPPAGKYYLVDSGHPNRVGYLAPFKGQRYHVLEFEHNPPVGRKETFNNRHSSLRNVIERSFGVLKMKWRILLHIPRYSMLAQSKIVTACACLHNYIRDSKLHDQHFDEVVRGGYVHEDGPTAGADAQAPTDDGTMATIRDAIAASLVTSE